MPRPSGAQHRARQAAEERGTSWFALSNAHASSVGEWELKEGQLVAAILSVLAAGDAIMFGRTQDGGAVSVTIYSGEQRQRVYCDDAIALDDVAATIVAVGRGRNAAGKAPSPTPIRGEEG